jgi:hypothetical protein
MIEMTKFIDDFTGAISDFVISICFFFTGALIVGVPLYLLGKFFEYVF